MSARIAVAFAENSADCVSICEAIFATPTLLGLPADSESSADYGARKPRFYYYYEKPEDFARISPHTGAANFKTPTLVIHNQMDMRVPVDQGIELFNTLQSKGVPSKLVYFPDENHWVLKPQNSLFWYRTVREWLEKYAAPGGQDRSDAAPPSASSARRTP